MSCRESSLLLPPPPKAGKLLKGRNTDEGAQTTVYHRLGYIYFHYFYFVLLCLLTVRYEKDGPVDSRGREEMTTGTQSGMHLYIPFSTKKSLTARPPIGNDENGDIDERPQSHSNVNITLSNLPDYALAYIYTAIRPLDTFFFLKFCS
jgi:hypothetical protein